MKKQPKSDDKFYSNNPVPESEIVGANNDTDGQEAIQTPYFPASDACDNLNTVVPNAMAVEQKKFNQKFKKAIEELGMTVNEYVAQKLVYKSVDELCKDEEGQIRFAVEQIDAIGTAIWNHESNGDAIIIADQTGVGKGRQAAGLLRYAILNLRTVPFFFTDKKHLINDIYRDLIAIGFDAGVPYKFKKTVKVERTEFSDDEILEIIQQDIKDNDDVRVEYSFPEDFNAEWLLKDIDEDNYNFDAVENAKVELIALYRQHILENGLDKEIYETNANYEHDCIQALRKGKFILTPFVPNRIDIKDPDGNILYPAMTKSEADAIYKFRNGKEDGTVSEADMELPTKYKLFAMPYSQVGTGYYKDGSGRELPKGKLKLFRKYSKNSVVILDESHKASGMNSKGELSNTGNEIFMLVKNAQMTTYLSATYAKRADNMPLYALKTSIRESGLSDSEMINAFWDGGNALQEAVSAELTRNGQLLRREKIIQGASEYYYEKEGTEIGDNQIAKLNKIAGLFLKVKDFSKEVKAIIAQYKKDLGSQEESAKYKFSGNVNRLTFQLFNFMLLGLKVRQTTEFAINKLKTGRKTVITVANTLESALDNLSKTFMSNTSTSDAYKIGDEIKNDFSLYMAYLLNYTMRYTFTEEQADAEGNKMEVRETIFVLDSNDELSERIKDAMLDSYKSILAEILDAQTGIPLAPIDMIKSLVKEAGFKVNEITGRQRCISFDNGYEYGKIEKREIKKTDIVVREFNENELDCLVINQSGATGISMHATPNRKVGKVYPPTFDDKGVMTEHAPTSLDNPKEVKKRAMVITQMDLDINVEVQKLGRINRTGQVYHPEYTYVISAIPSESRLTSLMEKKLRSLSANVSSNQEQQSYLFTADDFFSDVAVNPFNETMIDIGMRQVTASKGADIQEFTKQLYFFDFKTQKDFYDTFSKKLSQEIETLTAQGLYTGKMTSKDYYAKTIATYPFFIGDESARTSFGKHSFIEKATVTLYKEKNNEKNIAKTIKDRLFIKTDNDSDKGLQFSNVEAYSAKAHEILDGYQLAKISGIEKNIEEVDANIKTTNEELAESKKGLAKYADLEKAIALENELKEVNEKIQEGGVNIAKFAVEGNMEKVQEITKEMNTLQERRKSIDVSLVPYVEVLTTKAEHRTISREIKKLEENIEKYKRGKENHLQEIEEYKRTIALTKGYVDSIGSMQQLTVLEEDIEYDDTAEPKTVKYTHKFDAPVILTGITFPAYYFELTPGSIEVHLSGVSEKYQYTISTLHKKFNEKKTAVGFKPHVELALLHKDYKGNWNPVAGKFDNSYREDRYIIIGSLLKTYTLASNNDIKGQIIKYNTEDGKVRIGIEVADNKDLKDGQKPVYQVLEERYAAGNLNHPVYYDGNAQNIDRYISQYMYDYLLGSIYEHVDKKIPVSEQKLDEIRDYGRYYDFIFQVSSAQAAQYIIVKPNEKLWSEIENSRDFYMDGKHNEIDRITVDEFRNMLNVRIVSESAQVTDVWAMFMNRSLGIAITNDNYKLNKKSAYFPDIQVGDKWGRSRALGKIHFKGALFKNIFPTNIITYTSIYDYGFDYQAELTMDFDTLLSLLRVFDERKRKPTFVTSSKYFEKYKDQYVFEQFTDDNALASSGSFAKIETGNEERFYVNVDEMSAQEEWKTLKDLSEMMVESTEGEEKAEWQTLLELSEMMLTSET